MHGDDGVDPGELGRLHAHVVGRGGARDGAEGRAASVLGVTALLGLVFRGLVFWGLVFLKEGGAASRVGL